MGGLIRDAKPRDAGFLAWVKDAATEGLPRLTRRQGAANPDQAEQAWWDEARAAFAGEDDKMSHRNCQLAEVAGHPAGCVIAYVQTEVSPPGPDTPAVLVPLRGLLRATPGSLYIDSIAVSADYRQQGLARALLNAAEIRARALGQPRLTLIALSSNTAARPLYADIGYRDIAQAALLPSYWAPEADAAFLMEKLL
ncbi:N-acetyltransferase [Pseudooceanicola sp.]|uniref:GNAT family N-acetyltransferase n=1 Tax=Pseudooceanicola sp. TaxID=1914328 RepID=UPI00260F196F|nr:N-acetyltransferase [Pseudooceanicola sp.]MDF1854306.1 N-acetyltransferase [Pseudooceanicola sp.]